VNLSDLSKLFRVETGEHAARRPVGWLLLDDATDEGWVRERLQDGPVRVRKPTLGEVASVRRLLGGK
jgi:hypothetical protein